MASEKKTAIVTGAGAGIGRAIATRLAADGARVVAADIHGVHETVALLRQAGHEAMAIEADVSDEAQVRAMASQAHSAFGTIDILVNNAALSTALRMKPFEEIEVSEWLKVMAVNTMGPFLCCKAVSSVMRAQKSGRIVNMTSGVAFKGSPFLMHYVASKGALMSMTRALANELGDSGVTVNAVSPGYTLSEGALANAEFHRRYGPAAVQGRALKREAFPSDVVGAVAFLAGPDSTFITGQILSVDGGLVYH